MSEPEGFSPPSGPRAPRRLEPWQAVLAAVVGGVTAHLSGLLLAVLFAIVIVATYGPKAPAETAELGSTLPVLALSALSVSGVLLLTAVGAPLLVRVPLRDALGLRRAPWGVLVAAALGTLGVGAAGDLLASLAEWVAPEATFGTMRTIVQVAASQSLWYVLPLLALVPGICEELLFRGMLQRALGSSPSVVIIVAVAFSVYHLDPHQIAGTLPAGLYLGWLAARTGTTLVPIVAHVTNNCFALVATRFDCLRFGYGTLSPTPGWWLPLTLAVTAVCVALVVRNTRKARAVSDRI